MQKPSQKHKTLTHGSWRFRTNTEFEGGGDGHGHGDRILLVKQAQPSHTGTAF
jgi:hypothetical protein